MSIKLFENCVQKLDLLETNLKVLIAETKIREALAFKCIVCMDPMDVYVRTPCKHPICKDCYMKSLNSVNGNKCCICRREIKLRV